MASSSYTDILYTKSRYAYRPFDASGCVDSSADFSLAMLDMTNSDFRADYATIYSLDGLIAYYLGPEDPDIGVNNSKVRRWIFRVTSFSHFPLRRACKP